MTLTQINKAGLDELALDHVFTIGASGTDHYTFQGEGLNGTVNDPTLYLTRGKTYRFENTTGGHPIRIQSTSGASGTAYNTGVTNNGYAGTVIVEVQHDAPDVLYYQCTSHPNMNGILYITGALADGGVTTAKIADSAVTTAKLANNSVTSDRLANSAVTTAKIATGAVTGVKIAAEIDNSHITSSANIAGSKLADNSISLAKLEHGTSSNDGKFLRANNGADPSFETVTSTTINNNADNRVLTGTGSANTIQGETQLLFDSNGLLFIKAPDGGNRYFFGETGNSQSAQLSLYNSSDQQKVRIAAGDAGNEADTFFTGGDFGIGTNAPSVRCDISDSDSTAWSTSNLSVGLRVVNSSTTNGAAAGIELRSFQNNGGASLQFLHAVNDGASSYGSDLVFTTRVAYTGAYRESCRITNAGNLKFPSGHGIDFSATSGTGTSELLDDYEEGSFTPVYSTPNATLTTAYSSQDGKYTKIGNFVHFQIYLRLSSKSGGSGQLRINNLPFVSSGSSGAAYGGAVVAYTYNWSGDKVDRLMIGSSSTQVQLFGGTSGGTNYNQGAGNLNNDTQLRIFGSYRV